MASNVTLDEKHRRIYLAGEIDDSAAHAMFVSLHKLEETDGDITIIMKSRGGDEDAGYAIYDFISMCRNLVVIEAYGEVSSIAAAVFQAADVRRMAPHTTFLIHNGTMEVGEEAKQTLIVEMANQIQWESQRYYQILASRSRMSVTEIAQACDKDSIYAADECLTIGFCDEILVPSKTYTKPKRTKKKK